MEIIYERVAAIDVGKKEVAVTVRIPGDGPGAPRVQKVRKFKTFYPVLAQMVTWLVENGVTHVTMESTEVIRGSNRCSLRSCRSGRYGHARPVRRTSHR